MNDRLTARTHQLLVEQSERLEQQREAMRKALYAPLRTDADLPRRACSHCESGLTHCATPQACERAEQGKGRAERAVAKLTRAVKVGSRAERVAVGIVLFVVAALVAWAIAEAALIAAGVML